MVLNRIQTGLLRILIANTSDGSESEGDTEMDTDNESGSDVANQPSTSTARRMAEPPAGLVWKKRENFPRKWGFIGTS